MMNYVRSTKCEVNIGIKDITAKEKMQCVELGKIAKQML